MKIKKFVIDKQGSLWFERAGKMKLQLCPYCTMVDSFGDNNLKPCGDWCPSFHEPRYDENFLGIGEIEICDERANIAGEIVDERITK